MVEKWGSKIWSIICGLIGSPRLATVKLNAPGSRDSSTVMRRLPRQSTPFFHLLNSLLNSLQCLHQGDGCFGPGCLVAGNKVSLVGLHNPQPPGQGNVSQRAG